MPVQVNCPGCTGRLRVPDELFGKRVQCPTCESIFVAEVDDQAAPARPAVVRQKPRDDPFDTEPRSGGRYLQPHRGGLILALGIASLVAFQPLGIAAWIMGNNDLAAMRRGEMDRAGESHTQGGRICGMIASILMLVGCVFAALAVTMMLLLGASDL